MVKTLSLITFLKSIALLLKVISNIVFDNMSLEDMNKDINMAFGKLKITSEGNEDTIIEQGDYSHFTPLILLAKNDIRKKKKRPDTYSIYDYIMKTQASNADKVLIESVIVKLTLEVKS